MSETAAGLLHGLFATKLVRSPQKVGVACQVMALGIEKRRTARVEGGKGVVKKRLDLGGTDGIAGDDVGEPGTAVYRVEGAVNNEIVGVENGR